MFDSAFRSLYSFSVLHLCVCRLGLASASGVQVLLFLGGSGGLPASETTFAKRLQLNGYTTGLVGNVT